jgi:hypothetical protein
MTIRMTFLALFALISFAAGGTVYPPLARADNSQGYQIADNGGGLQKGGGRHLGFRKGLGQKHQQNQSQGGAGTESMKEKRQALREQLMQLPPDERKAKIQELKQSMAQQREQKLEQKKADFQSKWDKATPEQRTKFCSNVQQKCNGGDSNGEFACKVAQAQCAGQ